MEDSITSNSMDDSISSGRLSVAASMNDTSIEINETIEEVNETAEDFDSGVIENSLYNIEERVSRLKTSSFDRGSKLGTLSVEQHSILSTSSFEGHSKLSTSAFEDHSKLSNSSFEEQSKLDASSSEEKSKLDTLSFEEQSKLSDKSFEERNKLGASSLQEQKKSGASLFEERNQLRDANQFIDISDDESDGNLEPKIEEHVSSDESSDIEIVDSSDEISNNPKPASTLKLERGVKFEQGVKSELVQPAVNFQPVVKFEPTVKFEAGAKSEPDVKQSAAMLNPIQLVDDIKPIHTGKTGMATFNSQQSKAISLMQTLCKSLDAKPGENDLADNPKQLKIELMPHQRSALTWMIWREDQKPKGGILADDMGLGKTMSMISLVVKKRHDEAAENTDQSSESSDSDEDESKESKTSWIAKGSKSQSYYYGGTLVVCPASVLDQWKNEVKNRLKSNSLTVVLHHGGNRETMPRRLCKHDMVITTYGIVSSEADTNGALFSIKWERIILDEAHIIRNHTSKQSIACCKLKASARWALTGTPIQNKEADLFALLKFLRCRPFDDHSSFKMWISKSSSKSQERLNQVLQALLLRRTKEDLKEIGQIESLPEKSKEIVAVKLTTDEMNVYQKVMIYSQALFAQYLHQRESRNNFALESNSQQKTEWAKLHQQISKVHGSATNNTISGHHILMLILRLRQICIHPTLIDAMLGDGDLDDDDSDEENLPEVDLLEQLSKLQIGSDVQEDETISKASSKVMLRSNPVFDEKRMSSKFQKIIEYISEKVIGTDDKGIVVSQFASVLKMIGDHLQKMGIKFAMLTGSTKIALRNDIVTNFNNSSTTTQILLLSLTAGGVGLNLVGANHLFFVDPHWNPQLENQAQDRIYRIGQKKPVTIYKFLCDDTIERRIQHLQDSKLEIATQVLTGAKRTSSKLTIQDMKTLFDL